MIDPSYINTRNHRQRVEDSLEALRVLYFIESETTESCTPEQRTSLAKFAGAGCLLNMFGNAELPKWEEALRVELKELLTPEDYASLRNSVLTAYYTPQPIVSAIWQAAIDLGFTGGKVLDPGCGATANFLLFCPPELQDKVQYVGVEKDALSCRIAKRLFPRHQFYNKDFMAWPCMSNTIDMTIGNIPFTDGVNTTYNGFKYKVGLHNRIFLKSIDLLKPGGLSLIVTTTGTLDSTGGAQREFEKFRQYYDVRMRFLGAVRLPQQTFKMYNTDCSSDILVSKKRTDEDMGEMNPPWIVSGDSPIISAKTQLPAKINQYFLDYPDRLIGEMCLDKLTGDKVGLTLDNTATLLPRLRQALADITNQSTTQSTKTETEMYAMEKADWRDFNITYNTEHDGIELRFPSEPPKSVTAELTGLQFSAEVGGRTVRTTPKFYKFAKGGGLDPRWICKAFPSAIVWMQQFAQKYNAECDLPNAEIPSEPQPTSLPPTPITPLRRLRSTPYNAGATATQPEDPEVYVVSGPVPVQPAPVAKSEPQPQTEEEPETIDMSSVVPEEEPPKRKRKPKVEPIKGEQIDIFSWLDQLTKPALQVVEELEAHDRAIKAAIARDLAAKLGLVISPDDRVLWKFIYLHLKLAQAISAIAIQVLVAREQDTPVAPAVEQTDPELEEEDEWAAAEEVEEVEETDSLGKPSRVERVTSPQPTEPISSIPNQKPQSFQKKTRSKTSAKIKPSSKFAGDPIVLADEELQDTERFIGCYAEFNGAIGLSFKGLPQPFEMKIGSEIYTCQPGTFQPLAMTQEASSRISGLLEIYHVQRDLLSAESDPNINPNWLNLCRSKLNAVYDDFVTQFGYIADNKQLLKFDGLLDPRLAILPALEQYNAAEGVYEKMPIFYDRILNPEALPEGQLFFDEALEDRLVQALNKCLDETGGRVKIDRIAELAGTDAETAEEVLVEMEALFREPID